MHISLTEMSTEIVDDAAWTQSRVGLSSGDIYSGSAPFGHYVAAWYPDTNHPLQLLVTAVNAALKPALSIGFTCERGKPDSLHPVETDELPWHSDGILFGPIVGLEDIDSYPLAKQAIVIAAEIIRLDASLSSYIYHSSP
jgi:hypothetical protein